MSEGLRPGGWSGTWVTVCVPGVGSWGRVSEGASGSGRDVRQAEIPCSYLMQGLCGMSA